MKQKIKKLTKKGVISLGIIISFVSCSQVKPIEENITEIEEIKDNFTLEEFDDFFVKNNLEIDWENYTSNQTTDHNTKTIEINAYLKVNSTIGKHSEFKLLAERGGNNNWELFIIKFLSNNKNIENLSYFSTENFSGLLYKYNLNGKSNSIKVYRKGKLIDDFSPNNNNSTNTTAKAPAQGGTHCAGCWVLVPVEHFTDWYSNLGGGDTLFYTHSTYDGITMEWIYIPDDGNYYGMPYDDPDQAYHNHYDYPHSPGAQTDNHDSENVNPLLQADCRSFEFAQPPGALQKGCAIKDFNNTFYTIGVNSEGAPYYGEIEVNTPIIYFTMPNSITNGLAANNAAKAVSLAIEATDIFYEANPYVSEYTVRDFFNSALATQLAAYGGSYSFTNEPFPIQNPAEYMTSVVGIGTPFDCN